MLPSEFELCQTYDVSRTVVRQALGGLERVGAIYRIKGKGAFRAERKVAVYLLENPQGFHANMADQGLALETQALQHSVISAPSQVATALRIAEGRSVLALERLRLLEGDPIFLGTTYVPSDLCCDFSEEDYTGSLNEALARRCGLQPTRGKRIIETTGAGSYEAQLLQVSVGTSLFRLQAITYAQDDRPMEYTIAWLRGDRIAFEVNLK